MRDTPHLSQGVNVLLSVELSSRGDSCHHLIQLRDRLVMMARMENSRLFQRKIVVHEDGAVHHELISHEGVLAFRLSIEGVYHVRDLV